MIKNLLTLNENQSNLLVSKDLTTYSYISDISATNKQEVATPSPTDDDVAFNEAMRRGPTEDERIYFGAKGRSF